MQTFLAVLQLFLSSPKSTLKFAAIRTLAKLAQTHPNAVQTCNLDMEKLINDDNRSVATFAITTLLKTGNEASVDRLMKQISQFMNEISDEFQVIVVNANGAPCLKFPAKQSVMLNFLSGVLRDEGGYEFKRSVVEAIFDMIKFISDSKEALPSYPQSKLTPLFFRQPLHNFVNSSKIASSPSSLFEFSISSESKDLKLYNRRSTFVTSTTESFSRMLSFVLPPSPVWPSSESTLPIKQ